LHEEGPRLRAFSFFPEISQIPDILDEKALFRSSSLEIGNMSDKALGRACSQVNNLASSAG
jgi:hypothetical protein